MAPGTTIPLNRFSFFEELEDKLLPPMQLQFNREFNDDDELIHKGADDDDGRVVVKKLILWIPKLTHSAKIAESRRSRSDFL